jgi:RNA polymerase sigma-70 factor (ECF subfamily)
LRSAWLVFTLYRQVAAMMDRIDPEQQLERFREYLALLVRLQVHDQFQGKVDLSGLVQQTLTEAHQAWDTLDSLEEGQQTAWLCTALAHNLQDEVRKLNAACRNVYRERSLEQAMNDSSARLQAWLAAEQSSPSERAIRNEDLLRLAEALARLPEDWRTAVELHHLQGRSVLEVAELMGRSHAAVGALLVRGMKRLRKYMR